MFSVSQRLRLDPPMPPTPMAPRLSLSLGAIVRCPATTRLGRIVKALAAPAAAAAWCRKVRRVGSAPFVDVVWLRVGME